MMEKMIVVIPENLTKDLAELRLKHFEKAAMTDLSELEPTDREKYLTMLKRWVRVELAERKTAAIENRIRNAKFIRVQTIDHFNFDHSPMTKKLRSNYITLFDSIDAGEDLPSAVFIGLGGRGKTHLARALGYRACQLNLSVLFVNAAEMVNGLEQAKKAAYLDSELRKYRKPQVLIVDELGYVTMDAPASNLFFQVISARHDQGLGTIVTTNLAFGKWNQIFANDAVAHVIVDRLTAEAEVFFMEGDSYRPIEREIKRNRRRAKAKAKS
jgi:DNA replication protein DnaC